MAGSDKVRRALWGDIAHIAKNMRQADRDEVWAAFRHSPGDALACSLRVSPLAWTIQLEGEPIAMFGVGCQCALDDNGSPWLLGTDAIERVAIEFLRCSKHYIGLMLERFSVLENWADERNVRSIQWLKWCGFHFNETAPFGIDQLPFVRFLMEKDHV